jgi:hypothetical protein
MLLAAAMLIGFIPMLFWAIAELRPPKKQSRKTRHEQPKQTPWGDPER